MTEKGTVTIPGELRRKYGLKRGSKIKFIETEEGVLLVPIVEIQELFGSDRDQKELVYQMVRELHAERREASED